MRSLIECFQTVPGDIFSAIVYRLKRLGNILFLHFSSLKYHHKHNEMLQFWCADGSDSEEDK